MTNLIQGIVFKKDKHGPSPQEMRKFLKEAPDDSYLLMKVVLIIGVAGACCREELTNLEIKNVEDKGEILIINIPIQKPMFLVRLIIINEPDEEAINFLFRNGKCVNQIGGY